MNTLPFRVADDDAAADPRDAKGGLFSRGEDRVVNVPVDALRTNLQSVSESFLETLADIRQVGRFKLKEVKVKLEVGVEGGVNFIGTAHAKGSGAIELTFVEP